MISERWFAEIGRGTARLEFVRAVGAAKSSLADAKFFASRDWLAAREERREKSGERRGGMPTPG
jgi:hypothetical protein